VAALGSTAALEPVRVRYSREEQAIVLAQELIGLTSVDVREVDGGWEVGVRGVVGDRLIVRVLDAVRHSLGDDFDTSATVFLDGRDYQLHGGA
jgi:hypothetical protein